MNFVLGVVIAQLCNCMWDRKMGLFQGLILVLVVLPVVCLAKSQMEVSHISTVEIQQLELLFQKAKTQVQPEELVDSIWTCKIIGAQSRLQVLKNVKLYKFFNKQGKLKNKGSQPISEYSLEGDSFVGQSLRYRDEMRFNSKNTILSKWTSLGENKPQKVLAYASCFRS